MSFCTSYTILVLKIHTNSKTYHDSITAITTRAKNLAKRETLAHNSLCAPREGSLRRSDPGKSIKYFLVIRTFCYVGISGTGPWHHVRTLSSVPLDFTKTVLKTFQTSSLPDFNNVFHHLKQDVIITADMKGIKPEWPSGQIPWICWFGGFNCCQG